MKRNMLMVSCWYFFSFCRVCIQRPWWLLFQSRDLWCTMRGKIVNGLLFKFVLEFMFIEAAFTVIELVHRSTIFFFSLFQASLNTLEQVTGECHQNIWSEHPPWFLKFWTEPINKKIDVTWNVFGLFLNIHFVSFVHFLEQCFCCSFLFIYFFSLDSSLVVKR